MPYQTHTVGMSTIKDATFQETFKERGCNLTKHSKRTYHLAAKVEQDYHKATNLTIGHRIFHRTFLGRTTSLCLTMAFYTKPFTFSTTQSFIVLAR